MRVNVGNHAWPAHVQPATSHRVAAQPDHQGPEPQGNKPHMHTRPPDLHTWCHQPSGMNRASPASISNSCTAASAALRPGKRSKSGAPRSTGEWLADSCVTGCGCRCGVAAGGTRRTRLRPRTCGEAGGAWRQGARQCQTCWMPAGTIQLHAALPARSAGMAARAVAQAQANLSSPTQPACRTTQSRFW